MALGENKFLPIVIERPQIDVGGSMRRRQVEHLMISRDGFGMRIRIFFQRDAAGEPGIHFVVARRGLRPGNRSGGHYFLAFGKVHKKLPGDRLQQLAFVAERYPVLGGGTGTGFKQRIFHPDGPLPHGVQRLPDHIGPHIIFAQVANLFDFQQVGERIALL